jgi:hypothetical protein
MNIIKTASELSCDDPELCAAIALALDRAIADEREACAKVCNDIAHSPSNIVLGVALACENAIRARGKP